MTYLFRQLVHLHGCETSVSEHSDLSVTLAFNFYRRRQKADLGGNVVPVVLASQVFKVLLEQRSHLDDSLCHAFHLSKPLLVEGRIVENLRGNSCTMDRRVRVQGSDKDFQLRINSLLLFSRFADDRKCSNTFSIEALHYVSNVVISQLLEPRTMFFAKLCARHIL